MLLNLRRATASHPSITDTELTSVDGETTSSYDKYKSRKRNRVQLRTDESWRVAPGTASTSFGATTETALDSMPIMVEAAVARDVEAQMDGGVVEKKVASAGVKVAGEDEIVEIEVESPIQVEDRMRQKVSTDFIISFFHLIWTVIEFYSWSRIAIESYNRKRREKHMYFRD